MTKDEFWTNEELALGLLDKLRFKPGNLECTMNDFSKITVSKSELLRNYTRYQHYETIT